MAELVQTTQRAPGLDADDDVEVIETISDLIALVERLEEPEPPAPPSKPPTLLIFGVACSAAGTLLLAAHLLL